MKIVTALILFYVTYGEATCSTQLQIRKLEEYSYSVELVCDVLTSNTRERDSGRDDMRNFVEVTTLGSEQELCDKRRVDEEKEGAHIWNVIFGIVYIHFLSVYSRSSSSRFTARQ